MNVYSQSFVRIFSEGNPIVDQKRILIPSGQIRNYNVIAMPRGVTITGTGSSPDAILTINFVYMSNHYSFQLANIFSREVELIQISTETRFFSI